MLAQKKGLTTGGIRCRISENLNVPVLPVSPVSIISHVSRCVYLVSGRENQYEKVMVREKKREVGEWIEKGSKGVEVLTEISFCDEQKGSENMS